MCVTAYFKLFFCSCAIKTLQKVKQRKSLYNLMVAKITDELNSIYVFLRIINCHNRIGYEQKVKEENLHSGMVAEAERKRSL